MKKYILTACMFFYVSFFWASACFPAEQPSDMPQGKKFARIKGGCFRMGNTAGSAADEAEKTEREDELPVHEVCVGSFHASKYEITVAEFKSFVAETGYVTDAEKDRGCHYYNEEKKKLVVEKGFSWKKPGFPQADTHPVVCVSWNDANEYAAWLSKKDNKDYRLPSEAEWEYMAKGGNREHEFIFGDGKVSDNIADETAKKKFPTWEIWEGYSDEYVYTSPAGSFFPNSLGIYDLAGNVWEWTLDWYKPHYYKSSPKNNPTGPSSGEKKSVRGGSWLNKPNFLRTAHRFKVSPNQSYVTGGFRLVYPAE